MREEDKKGESVSGSDNDDEPSPMDTAEIEAAILRAQQGVSLTSSAWIRKPLAGST